MKRIEKHDDQRGGFGSGSLLERMGKTTQKES